MKKAKWLKFLLLILLALLTLFLFRLPVGAIGGSDIRLSSNGAAMPDMELSSDGSYLAVVYYKQDITGTAKIYLKSATANAPSGDGWVSSTFLGYGYDPHVAFKRGVNNIVYVVWVNSDYTAIQSARCTLNLTTQPTCTLGTNVRTSGSSYLSSPAIVVDGNNFLHVAWLNSPIIEMARATVADSVTAWPTPVTPGLCGAGEAGAPVLGWTTGHRIHLAFLCGSVSGPDTSVEYRRSADGSQFSTDTSTSFTIGSTGSDEISTIHSRLSHLAMAARDQQVSLIWDGQRTGSNFGLMTITSTDGGSTWPSSGSRWLVRYVPSGGDAFGPGSSEDKLSHPSPAVPVMEFGLRPSLVISGTTGNTAVVWQQRPSGTCVDDASSSSDIYYVNPQFTGGSSDTLEHTDPLDYSIDPDLVVGPDGVRHFVFMKDNTATNCVGGITSDYAIYYRGPFTDQTNDSDFTNLYIKNDTTGTVTYTVYGPPEGNITCSNIPAGATQFCGTFTPGIYNVRVDTGQCGSASGSVTFLAGNVTRQVRCGLPTSSVYLPIVIKPATGALTFENHTGNPVTVKLIGYETRTFPGSVGPHIWSGIPIGTYNWEATGTCNGGSGTVGSTQSGANYRVPVTIIANQTVSLNAEKGGQFSCGS